MGVFAWHVVNSAVCEYLGWDRKGYWCVSTIETRLVNMVLVFIPCTVWNRLDGKGDYCCAVWFSNICDVPVFLANLHYTEMF
jgi:hypothetical protein